VNEQNDIRGVKKMIKMNKLVLAAMVICASTAIASDGMYAGISLGNVHAQADVNRTALNGLNYSSNSGKNSGGAGAFAGFNHAITGTPLFIGLEANIASNNSSVLLNQVHGVNFQEKMTAQTKYSLSGAFKLGVSVNDLMLYVKAGVFKSQWRLNHQGHNPYAGNYASVIKTNSYGSVYGFGADHKLNNNWGIGIDHTVNTSQTISYQVADQAAKIDPVISTTSLRLTYTF